MLIRLFQITFLKEKLDRTANLCILGFYLNFIWFNLSNYYRSQQSWSS